MLSILAQRPALPARAFDIADGFAITLILMLFMVLGGVAWIASSFRRRDKETSSKEGGREILLDEEPPIPSSRRTGSSSASKETWERDPDWWKRED
ncbi:MAG: hypothetical protein ACI8T1_002512 [Verrucomicrobiales bacterium]|jgi:hypothetical protein